MEAIRALGRSTVTAALTVVAAILFAAAPAFAHTVDQTDSTNYRSTVTRLEPPIDTITVTVEGGDSYLRLVAEPGHTVVIRGYGGHGADPEPYMRVDPDGSIHVNGHSPANYLNEDRYAEVLVPPQATPDADPHWVTSAPAGTFVAEWHDHRIHWMSPQPPPAVQADPGQRHPMFDWTVPLTVDGQEVLVHGELEWLPSIPWWILITTAVIVAGLVFAFGRRRPRTPLVAVVGAGAIALAAALGAVMHPESSAGAVNSGLPLVACAAGVSALLVQGTRLRVALTFAGAAAVAVWAVPRLSEVRMPIQTSLLPPTVAAVLVAGAIGAAAAAAVAAAMTRARTEKRGSVVDATASGPADSTT